MNITNDHEVTIYKHEGEYGITYSAALKKKNKDDKYETGFIPVKFRKDVNIEDKTKLFIKSAWLTFNLKDKKTYPYIFINEYKLLDDAINPPKEERTIKTDDIEIKDEDLPF